jgi:hypothetical protein
MIVRGDVLPLFVAAWVVGTVGIVFGVGVLLVPAGLLLVWCAVLLGTDARGAWDRYGQRLPASRRGPFARVFTSVVCGAVGVAWAAVGVAALL